jgi:ribosome-binding protein aMBF1 (putative translation factor)
VKAGHIINQKDVFQKGFFEENPMPLPVPKNKYERLRVLLIEAREEAGLTQVELGRKLRRPQAFVSKIERGLRRVDVLEFLEIARAVGFDPHEIIAKLDSKGK